MMMTLQNTTGRLVASISTCLLLTPAFAASDNDYLWWEAENYEESTFQDPEEQPFRPINPQQAEPISNGEWIGIGPPREQPDYEPPKEETDLYAALGKEEDEEEEDGPPAHAIAPPYATYTVSIPEAGEYYFYARKFWKHGPFKWRINGGEWHHAPKSLGLLDEAYIRDKLSANWVGLGMIKLPSGKAKVEIKMVQSEGRVEGEFIGAFDAFVLGSKPFIPRGKMKPGEDYESPKAGWFNWDPPVDEYKSNAVDIGQLLNEDVAGQNGWIKAEGQNFIRPDGKKIRFFSVNMGPGVVSMDKASMDHLADWLAKRGVNMVRYHGSVHRGTDSYEELLHVKDDRIDNIHYMVHAMRERGIYTTLSIYFPLWVRLGEDSGLEGYFGSANSFAIQYFNAKFQKAYFNWWKQLLTRNNPYTDTPLSEDPAVAIVELVNEDSYFFYTFNKGNNPPKEQMRILGKQFGNWLRQKYGSVDDALMKWTGGVRIQQHPMDNANKGVVGILTPSELSNSSRLRAVDTSQFLTESMIYFHEKSAKKLKNEFDYKGLIYASNWKTADPRILGPLDKYANTVVDVMDRHGYYGPKTGGDSRTSHAIPEGSYYVNRSLVLLEGKDGDTSYSTPLGDTTYNNMPSLITETGAPSPNRYAAQFMLPMAAYSSLQGTDGIFWFALDGPGWQQMNTKFPIQIPAISGQFPGLSLLYREEYVKEADAVIEVNVKIDDIMQLKGSPLAEAANFDQLRKADLPKDYSGRDDSMETFKQLAHYVGKVKLNFVENDKSSTFKRIKKHYNLSKKEIESKTGELLWEYGAGMVTVNAPKAQGATGLFDDYGMVRLDDIAFKSDLHTGAFLLVSLDNKPIKQSNRMLLQVMSEDRNAEWKTKDIGEGKKEIVSKGRAPMVVKEFSGTVHLNLSGMGIKATTLDENGYPTDDVQTGKSFELRPDALYYLIERK